MMPVKVLCVCVLFWYMSFCHFVLATNELEVGTAVLPSTSAVAGLTTFTRIDFRSEFPAGTTPNVFTMTTEDGADPCVIRIRNVDNTGFDAACLEPINEDNAHPGMAFDYIAIQDGGITVPRSGGGGGVEFRSECSPISTQINAPSCAGCSGPSSYTPVAFTPLFTNTPKVITQIQTTNNPTAGEPSFIDVAFRQGTLSVSGFNVSLDNLEAGTSAIANSERVCYLAVDSSGCESLDFNTFGGPDGVPFEAVFGGNVDGHNNGCSAGEGANFTSGCFPSTPIAVAKENSRNGGDGHFQRRCSVNATRIILTADEDQVSNAERSHVDEEVSVMAFGAAFTTPVTLSYAKLSQQGRRVKFKWGTSAETMHLGFHLWGKTQAGWVQLNRRLIPGSGVDTSQPSEYKSTVSLTRQQRNEIHSFGVSSVDITGYEEFYGPFDVGTEYGETVNSQVVDWSQTRVEYDKNMEQRGLTKVNGRWRRVSNKHRERLKNRDLGITRSVLELHFDGVGIHTVSGAEIIAAIPLWEGMRLNRLALTINGQAQARVIESDDGFLDSSDEVLFYVKKPSESDSIYLDSYVYRLQLDRSRAIDASELVSDIQEELFTKEAYSTIRLTERKQYSAVISSGDPWFDSQLMTQSTPVQKHYTFDVASLVGEQTQGQLKINIFGGIDFPGDTIDHHAQISLNGQLIGDIRFDGLEQYRSLVDLPNGSLQQEDNQLVVTLLGDTGLFIDRILIDDLEILVLEELAGQDAYQFAAIDGALAYEAILNSPIDEIDVFGFSERGAISKISAIQTGQHVRFSALPENGHSDVNIHYAISAEWPSASEVRAIKPLSLHKQANDLLIVTHESFRGDRLEQFVQSKQESGFTPYVVEWGDMVETYGYGNNTPAALNDFLKHAKNFYTPSNILLVGGHTFDYTGVIDESIVNFIPAHYRNIGIFAYAATDNPYADLNGDNVPELSIGRWPVRSMADLDAIISKTLDWQALRDEDSYQDALLIAQQKDGKNLSFEQSMNGRVELPLISSNFNSIDKVYMQSIINSGEVAPINFARERIKRAIDDGLELLSFAGHGSTAGWGFQGIVNTDFIVNLENQGKPLVVMPLACYTTNYESIDTNSLAHQWMFAGEQGAVAVHGASVLGEYNENGVFAERYLRKAKDSATIGEAIKKAKQDMAPWNEMLHNWSLLGDPTLPLH